MTHRPLVKFGDIAKNIAVRVDPAEAKTDVYVGLEHLDPESLHLKKWGHPSDVTGQKLVFQKGDVIFGRRRAYQRKLAVAPCDGICSAHAMVLRAIPERILPEFLPFFLQSDMFMERAIDISVGSLSPTINWKTMRVQEFPLPPLEEQKRIAEILWAADEAVENYVRSRKHLENIRACEVELLLDSLACDPVPITEVLSGSPESGCSAVPARSETGHWVLSLAALSSRGYVRENLKPVKRTKAMEGATLSNGDLLLSRSNTTELVGFAGIFNENRSDVSFPDTMMRLPIDTTKIMSVYLEMVLLSPRGRRHMRRTASGTSSSMKKINRRTLAELKLPVPSLECQRGIVSRCAEIDARLNELDAHVEKLRAIYRRVSNDSLEAAYV